MGQKNRILVVDDDSAIGDMMALVLQTHNYDVIVSDKPDEAENIISTQHVDLVILDMLISGINGTDVCKRIRKHSEEKISGIPILMMSALHDAKEKCKLAGANEFLAKPFDVSMLISKVKQLMEI